mgnify:CR=1 FL=1
MCHDGGVSTASPVEVEPTLTPDEVTIVGTPWVTIVWNDPVNLMSYVTLMFMKLLGHPRPKAEALMLERLGGLPGVKALQTSFALRSTKSGQHMPLTHLE